MINTKYSKQKDVPSEPQQKFFQRFASAANRGHKGTYYTKGANQPKKGGSGGGSGGSGGGGGPKKTVAKVWALKRDPATKVTNNF